MFILTKLDRLEVDVGSSSESELVEKPEETEETTSDTPSTTEEYSTTTSESTTTMEEASGDDDERSTDATDGEERRLRRSYDPFGSDFMPWPKPPTNRKFNAKTMVRCFEYYSLSKT